MLYFWVEPHTNSYYEENCTYVCESVYVWVCMYVIAQAIHRPHAHHSIYMYACTCKSVKIMNAEHVLITSIQLDTCD